MITRRRFATGAALVGYGLAGGPRGARAAGGLSERLAGGLAAIERESGGRLGVAVLDTRTGAAAGHRSGERFPICSTFKLLAASCVLARVDAGTERLDRRIRFEAGDLVSYSPATKDRIGGDGMSVAELCAAAMTLSDNTAANLLLASLGGPAGLTAYARSIGDAATRLDRIEPHLNDGRAKDDPRDTTTPAAMLSNLRALVLGTALSAGSRDRLTRWLLGNTTGDARIRAGVPGGWRVGDKTGSGAGTANDVGIVWPPGRAPILLSIYLTETASSAERQNAALASVARTVAAALDA